MVGVLALLKSLKLDASVEELTDAMQSSAKDLGKSGKDKNFGNGLVQAYDAAMKLTRARM